MVLLSTFGSNSFQLMCAAVELTSEEAEGPRRNYCGFLWMSLWLWILSVVIFDNYSVNHVLPPKLQFYVGISTVITWIKYLGEYHALDRGIMLFSSVSFPLFATRVAQIVAQNTVDLQLCNHTNRVIFRSPQHVPNTRETHRVLNSRHLSHSRYSRPIHRNWRIHQSSKNGSFIMALIQYIQRFANSKPQTQQHRIMVGNHITKIIYSHIHNLYQLTIT